MNNIKVLKLSEFLEGKVIPFIWGAFCSRRVFTEDNKYIYIYTAYKESKKIQTKIIDYNNYTEKYIKALNKESYPYSNWISDTVFHKFIKAKTISFAKAYFIIENDLNLNEEDFFKKLYYKIIKHFMLMPENNFNEEKKSFIRGFVELRGSIDTTRPYITQDYFYHSALEMRKVRLLVDYLNVPISVININYRELQPDFHIVQRNTQLRFNIFWYMKFVGIINLYKAEIFAISRNIDFNIPNSNILYFDNDSNFTDNLSVNNLLDERINFYSINVFGKELGSYEIKEMREKLGFEQESASTNIRSYVLKETVKEYTNDICCACCNKYDISDRTHIQRKTGRYFFEIHHVISIGGNKELDDADNMVKLCPACHRALKKGAAYEDYQKKLISEIFKNSPKTLEFAKGFFEIENFEQIVNKTYESLK